MRIKQKTKILLLLGLLPGILVWLIFIQPSDHAVEPADEFSSQNIPQNESRATGQADEAVVANPDKTLATRLLGELELLKAVHGEAEAQRGIRGVFSWLQEAPVQDASTAVVTVLQAGGDAFTFGRFSPGNDGFLTSYPTFRTALLDLLEKLDPAMAVQVGKEILGSSENAGEWALSLRTLARYGNSGQDRAFLQTKVQELLHKASWLENPSFAYLHAFDAAVQDGQIQTIERLGELAMVLPNRPVAHAATLSVDRFFQQYSMVGAGYVLEHPEFLETETGFRASLMARVNPVNTQEMAVAEAYLDGEAFSGEEKRTFIQSFPNLNSTFSHNLITGSLLLSRADMRERGVAAFNQLSGWLAENKYPELEDEIINSVTRLSKTWKLDL